MDDILALAAKHNVDVMEDAAQSIGATHHGRQSCSLGRLGTLSFFPSKNLGAFGDAGMIVTNDEKLAHECRLLRNHGAEPGTITSSPGPMPSAIIPHNSASVPELMPMPCAQPQ